MIRETELADMAMVVEGVALKGRKRSVTERIKECGCSVAQYIKERFDLERVLGLFF